MESSIFVNQFYEMDPEFEDLLPSGKHLENGMVVLAESPAFRAPKPSEDSTPFELSQARERNRWAMVSDITIETPHGVELVSFIATYGDGTKKKRTCASSHAWLVKLDSMDAKGTIEESVRRSLKDHEEKYGYAITSLDELAEEIYKRIEAFL